MAAGHLQKYRVYDLKCVCFLMPNLSCVARYGSSQYFCVSEFYVRAQTILPMQAGKGMVGGKRNLTFLYTKQWFLLCCYIYTHLRCYIYARYYIFCLDTERLHIRNKAHFCIQARKIERKKLLQDNSCKHSLSFSSFFRSLFLAFRQKKHIGIQSEI